MAVHTRIITKLDVDQNFENGQRVIVTFVGDAYGSSFGKSHAWKFLGVTGTVKDNYLKSNFRPPISSTVIEIDEEFRERLGMDDMTICAFRFEELLISSQDHLWVYGERRLDD